MARISLRRSSSASVVDCIWSRPRADEATVLAIFNVLSLAVGVLIGATAQKLVMGKSVSPFSPRLIGGGLGPRHLRARDRDVLQARLEALSSTTNDF